MWKVFLGCRDGLVFFVVDVVGKLFVLMVNVVMFKFIFVGVGFIIEEMVVLLGVYSVGVVLCCVV